MPAPLLLALALAAAPSQGARVVDEVVAVVRNPVSAPPRAVTLSKLTEEARIALVSRGATAAATGPLDAAALRAALDWLLDQMLLADDAARLRLDEVPREDVLGELRRFRAQFASPQAYARFLRESDLSEDELLATLARMVRVDRYVASRIGRAARVSDAEVDRWLAERGLQASSGSTREVARAQMAEDRNRAQVKELIAELRQRAAVRVVSPPREGAGGSAP
jgi:hypothetical protein